MSSKDETPVEETPSADAERAAPDAADAADVPTEEPQAEAPADAQDDASEAESVDPALAAAEARAERAEAEGKELLDRLRRLQAEFDNYRNRVKRDAEHARARAGEGVLTALLPVADSFDRALKEPGDRDELVDGLRLIQKQLLQVFTEQGVERMQVEGVPFDPALHEALVREPSADHAEDTVLREFEAGYTQRGRVLRPARVSVSSGAPPEEAGAAEDS